MDSQEGGLAPASFFSPERNVGTVLEYGLCATFC